MPSLQQARRETLATRVDAARRSLIGRAAGFMWGVPLDPVPARVERMDGTSVDLQLEEVQLDAAELRGRRKKAVVALPLDEVKAVWLRRLRPRRAAAAYASIMCASALALVPFAQPHVSIASLVVGGVLLGGPLCAGAWIVLKRLKAFQEWVQVYDRADAPKVIARG